MQQPEYRPILVIDVDVPSGRRPLDPDWVAALAESIARHGQRTPIEVVAAGGRYRLISGNHRVAACRHAQIPQILAIVQPADAFADAAQERLAEITENFLRRSLSVLDRALNVADWRSIYEAAQGEVKRGRKNKSHSATNSHADPAMQAADDFACNFSEAAQRSLGLKRDTVFRLLKIARIDAATRQRIALTGVANSQADLLALADLDIGMRSKVLDLLFSTPPQAATVADAVILAEGGRLKSGPEKLLNSVISNFVRLSERDRRALFDAHEDAVRAYAREKGWL